MIIKKLNFLFFVIVLISFFRAINCKSDKKPFRYIFSQQTNSMCTIVPMINMQILKKIRKLDKQNIRSCISKIINDSKFSLNRREWLGKNFDYFFSWRKFLTLVMHSKEVESFLIDALNNALIAPNFYIKKDKKYKKITRLIDLYKYPFFLVDSSKLIKNLNFIIPIVNEKSNCLDINKIDKNSGWLIYNKEKDIYEKFSWEKLLNNPSFSLLKEASLFKNHINTISKDKVGFKSFAVPNKIWLETFCGKMPFFYGFLKLMFLVLGINNKNELISDKDPEKVVSDKMRELIQLDRENNPWSDKFFQKDNFIQYTMANVFKNNKDLYKKAKKVVDFSNMDLWKIYKNLISGKSQLYKDDKGTKYETKYIKKYLPGKYQILAYFFTQFLRILWYGAISKNNRAFYKCLGISSFYKIFLWFKGMTFNQLKKRALKEDKFGLSFVSVWLEIKADLQKLYPEIKDWISFDGHGWIISFDSDLIKLQNEIARKKSCDFKLLNLLGFAGIESWLGNALEVFYKI